MKRNPQQYPDQPVLITLRSERLDDTVTRELAPGLTLVAQKTKTGALSFVTHTDERLFVFVKDAQGRGCYFYQSFSGTGGKAQGSWFPSGGPMADKSGATMWVIKGSPKTDPGAGRVPLLELFQLVNSVFPQSDADTDKFVKRLTGVALSEDFTYKDEFEIVPLIYIQGSQYESGLKDRWMSWAYQFWALNVLDKTFGKRTFTPSKTNPYKAVIPIVSGIAYIANPTHFRRNSGKTYADLMEELRWLGPASVMKLVFNGDTRQCGESAFTVAQYLIERGLTARTDAGAGKYCSHYDLAVHTADQGWVSVDPTHIQFHAPNNESHALDIADRKLNLADDVHRLPVSQQDALVERFFEPTVQWSVAGMLDGTKAFEIAPAPHVWKHASPSEAETPGQSHVGKTWRQHWEWYRGMAEDLTRGDFDEIDTYGSRGRSKSYWVSALSRRLMGRTLSGSNTKTNPTDLAGRHIPERYLAGLPPALQKQRIRELTESRDAYKRGDYSELPTDRAARKMGLVKESSYTTVAKKRGIEWRGDARDMASRVLTYYAGRASSGDVQALTDALEASFRKGLAAWKSGGHRPGATAQNWAVARVNSLVVGGKTSWTADKKQFAVLPDDVRKKVVQKLPELYSALKSQGRQRDVESIRGKAKANPVVDPELKRKLFEFTNRLRPALLKYGNSLLQKYGSRAGGPEIVDQAVAEAREYIAVKMIQDFSDPLILSYLDYSGGLNELRGVGVQLGRDAMRKAIMKAMSVTGAADLEFWNRVGAAKRLLTRPGRAAPTDADVARYFGLTLDEFNTRKFQHRILTELSYEQLVGINRDPVQRGPKLDTADVLQPSAQTERRARALVYAEQEDAGSSYDEPAATAMQFIQEIFPAPDVAAIHSQFRIYEGYGALEGEVVQYVLENLNRDRRMLLGAYAAGDKTLPGLTERQFDVAIKGGYNPGTRTHSEGLLSVIRGEIAAAAEAIASLPEPRIAQIASGEVSVAEGLREAKSARQIAGPTQESDVPELAKLRRKRR